MNGSKVTIQRTIGPWGCGLAAFDADGRMILVLPVKTKSARAWMQRETTKEERERVESAIGEMNLERKR